MIMMSSEKKTVAETDLSEAKPGQVVLLGIPFDDYSTFLKGAALAPNEIRKALKSPSSNMFTESVHDLGNEPRLLDLGDLKIIDYLKDIQQPIEKCLEKEASVVALGGDHSVTYPIVRAFGKKYPKLNVLHFDAHPDLYDILEGNKYSHACPFARIMEEKLAQRLVQVGIRTMNKHQQEQAQRFNVEVIDMIQWKTAKGSFKPNFEGPIYISLDLDVLDPAFAPGISHYEPGGLSTRDVLDIIQNIDVPIVGADIVELNPKRDQSGMTAMVAAKFLKEIIDKMLNNQSPFGCN
jgi:arginase